MSSYYAVPVRLESRMLTYNPFDGNCAVASTPHDACLQLGPPETGGLFAVWPLTAELGLTRASEICSLMAPLKIFVVLGNNVMFPLGVDPGLDAVMEVPDAGRD